MGGTVDLRPDSFAEGGGLIDDFDGTISDIRFIMTNYGGRISDAIPVASVRFTIEDMESDPTLYSVGGSDDFAPTTDEMGLNKLKTKDSLTKTSKFGMFMASIVDAGFPLNKMESDNISYLVGLDAHFLRKIVEYSGLKKKSDRDNTVLLCTKINTLPWENKKVGKGKKGKPAAVDEGLANDVAGIIQSMLRDTDYGLPKKDLISALFKSKEIAALSDKKGALKLAVDDTFLNGREEWAYEDGVLLKL